MHNTTGELLWGISLVYQALARNTPLISLSNGFAAAGPCTPMVLFEAAAHGLASVVSGANLWEIAVGRNKYKNRATPMEAKMSCEVGCGAAESGIKRSEANELVKKIASKYESKIAEAPLGKTFQECYDVKKTRLLKQLLKIERHEDRMITAMVRLTTSNERLNRRLAGLTWVMLTLTWITFVIAIPNTLATIFGIPRVSQNLSLEVMVAALTISTAAALLLVALPDSALSLSNLEKRFRKTTKNK